jgi:hypothetical protein
LADADKDFQTALRLAEEAGHEQQKAEILELMQYRTVK